jgi:hypothetical protein
MDNNHQNNNDPLFYFPFPIHNLLHNNITVTWTKNKIANHHPPNSNSSNKVKHPHNHRLPTQDPRRAWGYRLENITRIVRKIIKKCWERFEYSSYDVVLSQDVEFKLDQVLEDVKEEDTGDFQTAISLRMKELAYSKILVLTYEKSFFRLVQAHFHIGKEYLRFKCYDQALFHLESALNKNIKAGTSSSKYTWI